MPSEKAEDLYIQALELAAEAEKTDDKRKFHDAASLLTLAINNAGEPYPDAEETLASIYIRHLRDMRSGWKHLKAALEHDPHHFSAQQLRVIVAYAEFKSGTSYTGFVLSREGNLNGQVRKLKEIFQWHCSNGLSGDRFLFYAQALIDLADMLAEDFRLRFTAKDLYRVVASVSTSHIVIEDEAQTKAITMLQTIAAGRSQM